MPILWHVLYVIFVYRRFQRCNFSVLTKHWALILLSKLSEHYAILGKWIKCKR